MWLDRRDNEDVNMAGALCRRHADAMVVPLNWALDDRRDPVPRLFRTPGDAVGSQRKLRRRTAAAVAGPTGEATVHQLRLEPPSTAEPAATGDESKSDQRGERAECVAPGAPSASGEGVDVDDAPEPDATAWIPRFEPSDDLDGLLDARGPLLSRAFTGGHPTQSGH